MLVATEYKLGLHNLLQALHRHGYTYEVLQFGQRWGGWRWRMATYRDAAAHHAARWGRRALVVFLDAYDVACLRGARDLAATFDAFGTPLVAGVESGCSPRNCGKIAPATAPTATRTAASSWATRRRWRTRTGGCWTTGSRTTRWAWPRL
jgi:hypothetical protein